jgi:DNA-binding SARP family transcriptional activator
MMAENTKAVQAADHGLRLAEESGVHVMDIWTCGQALFATLTEGDLAAAKGYLDRVAPIEQPDRLIDSGLYHHLRAWYHLLNEERIVAADHARFSVEVVERAGSPFHLAHACTVYGTVLHVLGQSDEGLRRLAQARSIGQALESGTVMYCSWIAEAEIHLNLGSESQALEALRRAFEIGRRCGFRNHTWWRADAMARLYAKALVHDIETEYVTAQIWRRHLTPRGLPEADLEHWPFPIKIYTFGRFSILVNGRPHNLTSQKKPIGLLKAIIVLGGNEVDEDRLLELLWPDAEGDSARQNLKITLHRLRKFLPDEAIRWENGQLRLDPDTVWVDRWVFERLLDKLDTTLQQRKPEATALGDRAFALYGGAFLTDDDAPWILSSRERLRDKLLRLLHRLGETMFMQHHYREALTYYEKGIEIDPLAERFYQDLMHCHQLLKQPADGLRVYRRCHDILKRELGVSPSPRTEALREALQTG